MTEVERIAKGLTKAQRCAMMWCEADGSPRVHLKGAQTSFYCLAKVIKGDPKKEIATMYALVEQGVSKTERRGLWPATTWSLTPLGIAVREYLETSK